MYIHIIFDLLRMISCVMLQWKLGAKATKKGTAPSPVVTQVNLSARNYQGWCCNLLPHTKQVSGTKKNTGVPYFFVEILVVENRDPKNFMVYEIIPKQTG